MLDALNELMSAGSIKLLSEDDRVLVTLRLSDPAATAAGDSKLTFRDIRQGIATSTGKATKAHVLGSDGVEVFSCDVGDRQSDAVIKLSSTLLERGGPVQIDEFRLAMP